MIIPMIKKINGIIENINASEMIRTVIKPINITKVNWIDKMKLTFSFDACFVLAHINTGTMMAITKAINQNR